jgi:peptidyl-prolyl cis-trans isomerase D
MLKFMRDSFHQLKWILIAVVAAFIIGFVFIDMGLGGSRTSSEQQRSYAARVNGETISFREYERALYYTEKNYEQMYRQPLSPEMIEAMGLPKQVLDSLVDQRLLLQEAKSLNLTATPEEVRAKVLQIPILNEGGKFVGEEAYNRYITGTLGYTSPSEFEEELRREITLQKMESAMANSLVISPKAAEAEYRRVSENAKIKYALLPVARIAPTVTVTDAEAQQYYNQNQSKYMHLEQRAVKYLIADLGRIRSQIIPADADLQKLYESSKEEYKHPEQGHVLHILVKVEPNSPPDVDAAAKAKAEGLVKQLRAGADFATLARANSQDPSSSGNGGDMGFIDRGTMIPAFDDAVYSIPLNQISDPIHTQEYGYHIIKVLERRPAGYRSFAEVKPILAAKYTDTQSKERAKQAIDIIAAKIKQAKPKTAEEFSKLANETVSSNDSQWFGKTDSVGAIGNNPAMTTWAFAAKKGETSEIMGTQRGPAIAYLYDIRTAGATPFAEVKEKAMADARNARARELAKQQLAAALPAANVDELAAKIGVSPAEVTVNRMGAVSGFQGDTSPLVDAAMAAKVGELKGPIVTSDGAVAFQVLEQKKIEPKEVEDNKANYAEMLRQQEARSLRTVLLQRLRKGAKVDVNEQLLQTTKQPQQQAGL